ncbi:MAG: DNA polymerase III subunit beta [Tissierellia bacterium]|nr:DNA polymerase III subunit beta [Tissierellia bacterium]
MKIKVQQKDLINHITIALKAVSSKTNISYHELINFKAKGDSLYLYSSDGEISIITKLDCRVEEEGNMAIKANIISNIIRKLPDDIVYIDCTNDKINIKCNKSNFNIIAFDYYQREENENFRGDHLTLDNMLIKNAVSQTEFATSTDETKLAFTGIFMECELNKINIVALDGYRIALKSIKKEYPSSYEGLKAIIPKRSLIEWQRIIDENSFTDIYKLENDMVFVSDDTIMYTRLIDKNYVDYKSLLVDNSEIHLLCDRREIINAIDRASLLSDSGSANLIRVKIVDNEIIINSNSQLGDVREVVKAKKEGKDLEIAFNANYISEGIRAIQTDKVSLNFKTDSTPCLVYPEENEDNEEYTFLVLPVRLANTKG